MKRKEAENVMCGKDAWANVDKTYSEYIINLHNSLSLCVCVCVQRSNTVILLILTMYSLPQRNVLETDAMVHKLSFIKFRSEVRTSR